MKKTIFYTTICFIGFFAFFGNTHAQYMPSAPGMLGVGAVTENSIEWTFNLGGSLVTEVQLFVGDETAPRVTQAVANYATSIVETGLAANTRYDTRRVRAAYYGTAGAMSAVFPAGVTLQKVPSIRFEALPPNNTFLYVENATQIGTELSAWQLYEVERDTAWRWIKTESFQSGPFEPGKSYAFKVRARNLVGRASEWSQPITYTPPASETSPAPSVPTVTKKVAVKQGVAALNVRTLPSIAGKRITVIRPGIMYDVLGEENGWYRIQFSSTVTGWVSGKYTAIVP